MYYKEKIMTLEQIEKELASFLEGTDWLEADRNILKVNVNWLDPSPESAEIFNRAYNLVKDWKDCITTPSGGISKSGMHFRYFTKKVAITKSSYELTIIAPSKCYILRFRHDYGKGEEGKMAGKAAFSEFKKKCQKEGLDLATIAIDNGKEIKETIPMPDIRMFPLFKDKVLEHAFHVDINSAYMAGIKKAYGHEGDGALGRVIQDIFDHRKDNNKSAKYNKAILNCSQGFMQSAYCILNHKSYALAHLSKAGIEYCYNTLQDIIAHYKSLGCTFVATNTDGAWFLQNNVPEEVIRATESKELGEYKVDHWDCKLRYKTKGAYEFIENGVYNVKMRGKTRLDKIKPREQWVWGDIYQLDCEPIKFKFIDGEGIIEL